jgi:hypothetical protein
MLHVNLVHLTRRIDDMAERFGEDAEGNRRLAIAVPVSEVPQAVRRNNA